MKINGKLKSYLIIIAYLIVGLIIMGTVQLLKVPDRLNSIIVLLLFVSVNIATARALRLNKELKAFWSLRKIVWLPPGIIIGGLIAVSPVLLALLTGKVSSDELTLSSTFTVSSIALTLIIVAWEELWFRGIFLNHCNKYLSETNISITIGLLFMLVHILNPEIKLLKTGPTLFFAGAFLTIVYFYFKTIWLPIGLHFGNNYLAIETKIEKDWLLGNEGYLSAFILAGLFLLFVKLTIHKNKMNRDQQLTKMAGI